MGEFDDIKSVREIMQEKLTLLSRLAIMVKMVSKMVSIK